MNRERAPLTSISAIAIGIASFLVVYGLFRVSPTDLQSFRVYSFAGIAISATTLALLSIRRPYSTNSGSPTIQLEDRGKTMHDSIWRIWLVVKLIFILTVLILIIALLTLSLFLIRPTPGVYY